MEAFIAIVNLFAYPKKYMLTVYRPDKHLYIPYIPTIKLIEVISSLQERDLICVPADHNKAGPEINIYYI